MTIYANGSGAFVTIDISYCFFYKIFAVVKKRSCVERVAVCVNSARPNRSTVLITVCIKLINADGRVGVASTFGQAACRLRYVEGRLGGQLGVGEVCNRDFTVVFYNDNIVLAVIGGCFIVDIADSITSLLNLSNGV